MDTLEGIVERITYYNEETGYTVLRLKARGRGGPPIGDQGLITIVGNLPEITPGESLKLRGQWTTHRDHGRQFKAESCEQVLPATVEGIKKYLGSGLIKGVGPVTAERIVKKFGLETLDVLDHDPGRIREVLGVGPKRATSIGQAWADQKVIKQVMLFLQSHGVTTGLAVKIFKQYGDAAIDLVQSNPYQLASDIYGIGFKTADKIARELGLPPDAPTRVAAGVTYTLSQSADQGHVFLPQSALVREAMVMLDVKPELVIASFEPLEKADQIKREVFYPIVDSLSGTGGRQPQPSVDELLAGNQRTSEYPVTEERLSPPPPASLSLRAIKEEPIIYLTPFYHGEVGVARRLSTLLDTPTSRLTELAHADWAGLFNDLDAIAGSHSTARLSDMQRAAVRTALTPSGKVTVLTGGPGTGKTTTVRAIITLLERFGKRYALAAPTGRAAKRLNEATERTAKTIHRLLEFSPAEGFKRNEFYPLDIDTLIVDEASMIDLLLMNHLLKAVPPGAHVLLVGDVDQLPSVGAGDVLRDVIGSGRAAVIRLDVIFRQAQNSLIITNAHRINKGQMPITPKDAGDFFMFVKDDAEQAAQLVAELVTSRIPNKFGIDPWDIQVLAPMYRGAAGVSALNANLQLALNPPSSRKIERRLSGTLFRVGDRVMQTRNNYNKDVYNGDMGRVTEIDLVNQSLRVTIDDRPIDYDWAEADELAPAYAVSVHKAQGSEYPAIVLTLLPQHYLMLQRNLLYTAITRARRLCVLVGSRRAVAMAVKNNQVTERYSGLLARLQR
ncbi:MAG TPA: AAA family ATPase [Anaerolineae bacterium]|nr:AAA family ATPase [Anaerolineae bacterium]